MPPLARISAARVKILSSELSVSTFRISGINDFPDFKIIIVGAGAAAHLAGVIASQTILPVIGIPIDATSLHGLDALLSTVQMPGGVPVASMAIGKAGAKNAALFAARVLAIEDKGIRAKLSAHKKKMSRDVEKKQENIACRKS